MHENGTSLTFGFIKGWPLMTFSQRETTVQYVAVAFVQQLNTIVVKRFYFSSAFTVSHK